MEKAPAAKEKERSLSALMRVKLKKTVGKKAPAVGPKKATARVARGRTQRLSSPTSSHSGSDAGVLLLLARSASGSRTGGAVASATAMEQEAHEDSIEQEGQEENNYEPSEEDMPMDEEYSDDIMSEGDPFGLSPGTDEVEQQTEVPGPGPGGSVHCHTLLYNLMVLREKVQLLHPLVGLAIHDRGDVDPAVAADAGAIVQEIFAASSSMMHAFQHLCGTAGAFTTSAAVTNAALQAQDSIAAAAVRSARNNAAGTAAAAAGCSDHQLQATEDHEADMQQQQQQQQQHSGFYDDGTIGKPPPPEAAPAAAQQEAAMAAAQQEAAAPGTGTSRTATTIIELDAAELLAKYTDYCQVCGKGFKREANLRMHMRAHGDQYKSKAALVSPLSMPSSSPASNSSKYSCPQEGCRRNMRHARFTPLSSVICAKNHYKRSHCPKMYVCNRCGRKHFSVLSDLRTHEKHCGHSRWLCSCGTTFSRKDKLAGHVSTFAGHHSVAAAAGDQHTIDRSSSASSDQLLGNCTNNGGAGASIT